MNSLCHKIIMELQSLRGSASRRDNSAEDIMLSSFSLFSSEPLQPYLV